jgi:hypothetical protein
MGEEESESVNHLRHLTRSVDADIGRPLQLRCALEELHTKGEHPFVHLFHQDHLEGLLRPQDTKFKIQASSPTSFPRDATRIFWCDHKLGRLN